jgi:hypothetical protein
MNIQIIIIIPSSLSVGTLHTKFIMAIRNLADKMQELKGQHTHTHVGVHSIK